MDRAILAGRRTFFFVACDSQIHKVTGNFTPLLSKLLCGLTSVVRLARHLLTGLCGMKEKRPSVSFVDGKVQKEALKD
jgi:hypothetical protein